MSDLVDILAMEAEQSSTVTEVFNSVKVSLADLCAKGTAQYAQKNWSEAAELFSRASELQAELNGEMAPGNADILFLFGRSLFKVGQSNSDVLGGKAAGEEKKKKKQGDPSAVKGKSIKSEPAAASDEAEAVAEAGVAIIAGQNDGQVKKEEEVVNAKKPLFQFTGDENFEDSDSDEDAVH